MKTRRTSDHNKSFVNTCLVAHASACCVEFTRRIPGNRYTARGCALLSFVACIPFCTAQPREKIDAQPRVVTPGALPGQPPSDAIVLFDGKDVSQWVYKDGRDAAWPVVNGLLTCKSGTGNIYTRRKFGSAQIHVEFATPYMPNAHGQARANSGVYLQGRYEIQILDSFENPTYSNGSAGSLYGQYAPLVNVTRPPKEWQTYDIIFHAPVCGADRKVATPGTVTVLQNGVLVQDNVAIKGRTTSSDDTDPCDDGPLMLQDHFHPDVKETFMQFRNIWIRPLQTVQ